MKFRIFTLCICHKKRYNCNYDANIPLKAVSQKYYVILAIQTTKATKSAIRITVTMRSVHVIGPTCLLNSFQFISAAALSIEPVNLLPADFIPVHIKNMISAMPIIAHVSGDIGKNHIINPFFAAKLILIPDSCKGKSLFLQIGLAAVVDDGQQERLVAAAGALDADEPVLGAA